MLQLLLVIICVILVAVFWRILLPFAAIVAVIAVVSIGALLLYVKIDNDRSAKKQAQEQRELQERLAKETAAVRERIARAKATVGSSVRSWEVSTEPDPASGEKMPRSAGILSEDGLCRMQVEQRMNGAKLTAIYCPGLKISTNEMIEVKFDNRPTSDKMPIQSFSGSDDAYISSSRSGYGVQLQYEEFLKRMTVASKVALLLTIDRSGQNWIVFSLTGAGGALGKIGAVAIGVGERNRDSLQRSANADQPPTHAVTPKLPANAELTRLGNDWKCSRGYRRAGNECVTVEIPAHAELNYLGNDWKCSRGFRRIGNACVTVDIPANAELTYLGNDWKCSRGHRRIGGVCVTVQPPANAELNHLGNDWKCIRGYRRVRDECVPVGV